MGCVSEPWAGDASEATLAESTGGLGADDVTLALVTKQAATHKVATRIRLVVLTFKC